MMSGERREGQNDAPPCAVCASEYGGRESAGGSSQDRSHSGRAAMCARSTADARQSANSMTSVERAAGAGRPVAAIVAEALFGDHHRVGTVRLTDSCGCSVGRVSQLRAQAPVFVPATTHGMNVHAPSFVPAATHAGTDSLGLPPLAPVQVPGGGVSMPITTNPTWSRDPRCPHEHHKMPDGTRAARQCGAGAKRYTYVCRACGGCGGIQLSRLASCSSRLRTSSVL